MLSNNMARLWKIALIENESDLNEDDFDSKNYGFLSLIIRRYGVVNSLSFIGQNYVEDGTFH